LIILKYLL